MRFSPSLSSPNTKNSYDQYAQAWDCGIEVPVGDNGDSVRYFHTKGKDNVERVFVDHESFLAKVWGKTGAKLYGSAAGSDYADNQARFALFCRAALAAIDALPFVPGGHENSRLTIVAKNAMVSELTIASTRLSLFSAFS